MLTFVIFVTACGPWERADEFVSGLDCGMTLQDVQNYTRRFDSAKVVQQNFEGGAAVVVTKGNTAIQLWMPNGQLQAAQITWHDGRPTSIYSEPRVDLCSR